MFFTSVTQKLKYNSPNFAVILLCVPGRIWLEKLLKSQKPNLMRRWSPTAKHDDPCSQVADIRQLFFEQKRRVQILDIAHVTYTERFIRLILETQSILLLNKLSLLFAVSTFDLCLENQFRCTNLLDLTADGVSGLRAVSQHVLNTSQVI